MSRMIVTKTKIAKEPFQMKESGHCLYSYEELCYYIYSRMSIWLVEKERIGLTTWLENCGIMVHDVDTLGPMEAAEKILAAGSYFRQDEKRQILDRMRKYKDFSAAYVEKDKGDLYLSYGKSKKAYLAYDRAAASVSGEESDEWKASLYHNMGIACCRFFYWEEAEKWFEKAKAISDRQETLVALTFVSDMKKMDWTNTKGDVLCSELEKKKQEFLNEL